MTASVEPVPTHNITPSRSLATGWPLAGAVATLAIAMLLGSQQGIANTSPATSTLLILLATLAGAAGAVAWLRAPAAGPTRPFVGLSAAAMAILALTPIEAPGVNPIDFFALSAPWRYALTPMALHFALAIGWPHRQRYWYGVVVGWYLVHAVMLVAAISGLATGELPLFDVADQTFRARLLEPVGMVAAIAALGIGLASPRRAAQRRATGWAFAALLAGLGPMVLAPLIPELAATFDGAMTPLRLALALVPFLGLAAVLALPFVNPINRDLLAHRLSQRLLETGDFDTALGDVAHSLREAFEAEGVTIRVLLPELVVSDGSSRWSGAGAIAPEAETVDDRRTLVAPIGRSGDPLGEVRLDARHAGAFGRREREWLAAFLLPIASALRARRREIMMQDRQRETINQMHRAADRLGQALEVLPYAAEDDGMAVPPPVDASEVLNQLGEGLDGVSRHSDDLERQADLARAHVRQASDEVARALDSMRTVSAEVLKLSHFGEEIAASNQQVGGVAFRTNLLANNAAIEATRAGSAGRTFGVLAEEIRRLADAADTTSTDIAKLASSLSAEVQALTSTLEMIRHGLGDAIRESEAGEDATRRLSETAGAVLGNSRSLMPAVEEAWAVAKRRSARDDRLTTAMERFLDERSAMSIAMAEHRHALERLRDFLSSSDRDR